MNDREQRRKALEAAKERLAKRKREREQLRALREQRKQGQAVRPADYGQAAVSKTTEMIERWQQEPSAQSAVAASGGAGGAPISVPGRRAVLQEVAGVNSVMILKREKERYDKSVSTDGLELAQDAEIVTGTTSDEEIERIMLEFMSNKVKPWPPEEKKVEKEEDSSKKEEEEVLLGVEEEEEKKGSPSPDPVLTAQEAEKLMSSSEFGQAFEMKSRWMERVLGVNQEHAVFWELDEDKEEHKDVQEESLKHKQAFQLKQSDGRAVTCLDFSKLRPDAFLVAHSSADEHKGFGTSPDGCVNVWNYMLPQKPEHALESQSMVTVAKFHPTNPKLVLGATVTGQIIQWDTRAKNTPQFRSRAGHYCPVYAMKFLPSHHRKMLPFLSVSNDGKICMWNDDFLVEPKSELMMKLKETRADEIPSTCFSFPPKDSKQVILGCDEGSLYKVDVHNAKETLSVQDRVESAHFGPITAVEFHPAPQTKKVGRTVEMLFLTSSYDWTVKLWHCGKDSPQEIAAFREMQDYVYDVQWSPSHPSVFACCDGSGKITVFDMNYDFESPVSEPTVVSEKSALTKLAWGKDGRFLLSGDSEGVVQLYEVSSTLYDGSDEDFRNFEEATQRRVAARAY